MKRSFCCWLLISVVFIAASAIAADMPNGGCTLQGSWMSSTGDMPSLVTDIGESASSGTFIGELFGPNSDPKLGGMFPDGARISTLRGMWERTGGNAFAFTQIWYGLDAEAKLLWIGKNSGIVTMSKDCNQQNITGSTFEIFLPEENPFGGTPIFAEPLADFHFHRMRIDPPATFNK
jgi:hypothetical protein